MLGQPAPLERFASRRPQVLAVRTVCDLVLGKMDKACEMKHTTLDSPLGKLELSGCEQGLHEIKLLGKGTSAAEVVHQTGVMEAAEGCEIRRSDFLPAISSPGRQPQSRASSGRSNERQSCPHPHPVPQSGLQQRSRGQLLRRTGREGMASGPRRPPVGEARLGRELRSGRGLAQGSGSYLGLPACWPKLSVCSRMDV
ncbi:methylated-DNA--protein-cysteine methyltransferase isoform X3 [Pan troglodytes]|uniref:methylated-DNA--protein-cysteine methyltransferase isoform X3 n=1 Tax=Pan troglodytes TaxID=9598 RepID=UPI0023F56BD0|nr:methylated-DNA--protein-cysteine methyltransferase isoform X3 [Pan troglodytes]